MTPRWVFRIRKRHLPVYFMKRSRMSVSAHPSCRTQKGWKNYIEDLKGSASSSVGCLPESCTLMQILWKLGTVGRLRYVITSISFWSHRLTGFGVSRHPSWVPAIDKAHRAYYIAVHATAWTHDKITIEHILKRIILCSSPKLGSQQASASTHCYRL